MALWMKNRVKAGEASWTVSDFNYYPNGATAVSIVSLLLTAMYTDWNKKRYHVNLLIAVVMIVSASLILAQSQLGHGGTLSLPSPLRFTNETDLTDNVRSDLLCLLHRRRILRGAVVQL